MKKMRLLNYLTFVIIGVFNCLPFFVNASSINHLCSAFYHSETIIFSEAHFPSSEFGLVHATRSANDRYSKWSAETSQRILSAIRRGDAPQKLFNMGVSARQDFARTQEGIENPEKDFGAPRKERSLNEVGEDLLGMTTVTVNLKEAEKLPEGFEAFPNPWWKNIYQNGSRNRLADHILHDLYDKGKLQEGNKDVILINRYFETLDGTAVRSTGTKLTRAILGDPNCPMLVVALNSPKSEIETIVKDVYRRIQLALETNSKDEARYQLAVAMNGFFSSMPYYRGTAAIGRVVFSALFSYIEGVPVTIHPEADVRALLVDQYEYSMNISTIVVRISLSMRPQN